MHINLGWHRLRAWPDSVPGLTRLKSRFIIGPLSNGNVSLLLNMAKFAGIPWDMIFGSDLFGHFKPDPETYLGVARLLDLRPDQVMMAAAHNGDLSAARRCGLLTAFFPRPAEYGPHQDATRGRAGLGHRRRRYRRPGGQIRPVTRVVFRPLRRRW